MPLTVGALVDEANDVIHSYVRGSGAGDGARGADNRQRKLIRRG
jgi:hypothetical protein